MIRKIGFVGLGTVGRHMALNLCKSKYELSVFHPDRAAAAELVACGARAEESAMATAKGKELVILIAPEEEVRNNLVFGDGGLLQGLDPGTILVDMGTHSLDTTSKLAQAVEERHARFLEAPVWGSREHAANGMLTILTAGEAALLDVCRDPFSCFGLNIIHISRKVGDATRMKLVVNMVQAELMQALSEGLVVGEKLGLKADKLLEVLDSGGVASPLFHSKGRSIARGDFTRNLALKYVLEQLNLVLESARELDVKLPVAETVARQYQRAFEEGRGEEDFSAVVKLLKR